MFSCEYCETFKNKFFIEHLWVLRDVIHLKLQLLEKTILLKRLRELLPNICLLLYLICQIELKKGVSTEFITQTQNKMFFVGCLILQYIFFSLNFVFHFELKWKTNKTRKLSFNFVVMVHLIKIQQIWRVIEIHKE